MIVLILEIVFEVVLEGLPTGGLPRAQRQADRLEQPLVHCLTVDAAVNREERGDVVVRVVFFVVFFRPRSS